MTFPFLSTPHRAIYVRTPSALENVQDFLIKLGIKPGMHTLETSIFSLNHVIVRPTKIMKDLYIQSHFSASKINGIFLIFFSVKNIRLGDQLLIMKIF